MGIYPLPPPRPREHGNGITQLNTLFQYINCFNIILNSLNFKLENIYYLRLTDVNKSYQQ